MGKAERMSALVIFLGLLLWTWLCGAAWSNATTSTDSNCLVMALHRRTLVRRPCNDGATLL
jgi:hypothetical protein